MRRRAICFTMKRQNFIIALLMLSLTVILVFRINARGVPVILHTNLENLPTHIAQYQGVEDFFSQGVYDELQADRHVYRHYRVPEGRQIDLYIGYYGTAKGGRTGHNPYACLPGSGWAVVENSMVKLRPTYSPQEIRLNYILSRKGRVCNIILHWYQSAGTKILSSGFEQNIQRFKGRLLYNRNDGAYVQVSSLVDEQDIPLEKEKLLVFASKVLELLPRYWPEEVDVTD
jgi:EpsI family protein